MPHPLCHAPSPLLHTHFTPTNLTAALIALNLVTFAMFGIDKAKAETGAWRVAESTLLMLALLGGTLGAYAGRALFRHKTRKQPFGANLLAIAVLQVLALGALIGVAAGWPPRPLTFAASINSGASARPICWPTMPCTAARFPTAAALCYPPSVIADQCLGVLDLR